MAAFRAKVLGLLLATVAGAASALTPQTEAAIEAARESVRAGTEWVARSVDGWFGDVPFEEGGKVTSGRIGLSLYKREDDNLDANLRFNARLRLPNVERQGYLFFGRDNERDLVTDTPDALSKEARLLPDTAEERSFFAGLGFVLHESLDFRIGFRGGLKPYAQVRYRHTWPIGEAARVDFRETAFWTVDDRLGSTTAVSYERALSPTVSMRWLNAATVTQTNRNFSLSSLLGAYKAFGIQRVLALELQAEAQESSGVGLTDYGVQTRWQQPLHKDWLLGEILVGHFWPRPDVQAERRGIWALGLQMKMDF